MCLTGMGFMVAGEETKPKTFLVLGQLQLGAATHQMLSVHLIPPAPGQSPGS